jgi:hypothetical protein
VDSVWEQEKLEASLPKVAHVQGKMLENAAESPASSARCVGTLLIFMDMVTRNIPLRCLCKI